MNPNDQSSALYDPASPNTYDPFQSPKDHIDRPPSAKSYNPRSLDLDDPGPIDQLPLSYDDELPSSGPLKEVLQSSKDAAEKRAYEAEELFAPIANILDLHIGSIAHMQVRQANALKLFRDELVQVASKHFDAYIRGTSVLSTAHITIHENSQTNTTRFEKSTTKTYANAVKSCSPKLLTATKINSPNRLRPQVPKEQADDRLFLRLSNDNPLRSYSGFALLEYIKLKLGEDKYLITNVLPTKTGFALCPSKGDTKNLEDKIAASNICADVPIEKASPWTSYRLSNVPRKSGTIGANFQHTLAPVTIESIIDAITSAAGAQPVSVTPSKDNAESPDSPSTTWIVRLPENHVRPPRVLFLFGRRTTTRILPRHTSVTQCTRCWLWHNSRICASPPRCRLCGSTQHTESGHANQCEAPIGHICPPKCIHCHGPHSADDIKCELRPTSRAPKNKAQIAIIRRISTEARLRCQAEAGCIKASPSKQIHKNALTNIQQNKTSAEGKRPETFPTATNVKSVNLFETLNNAIEPSIVQIEA